MATPPAAKRRRQSEQPESSLRQDLSTSLRRSYTPSRPSFASPTKASLARYNPAVLARSPRRLSRYSDASPNYGDTLGQRVDGTPQIDLSESFVDPALLQTGDTAEITAQIQRQVMESFGQALSDVFNGNVPTLEPQRGLQAELTNMREERQTPSALSRSRARPTRVEGAKGSATLRSRRNIPTAENEASADELSPEQRRGGPVLGPDEAAESVERSDSPPPKDGHHKHRREHPLQRKSPSVYVKSNDDQSERYALQKELQRLKDQSASLSRSLEHIVASTQEQAEPDEITSLLASIEAEELPSYDELQPPALTTLLDSFLPFSVPIVVKTEPANDATEYIAPSCRPSEDLHPLPHLQLFTPLKLTHELAIPDRQSETHGSIEQRHEVNVKSPDGLLSCDLVYTIIDPISNAEGNTSNPSVENLEVRNISTWAARETKPWIDACAAKGDVSAIGYGLGRYWDVVLRRKVCWQQCRKLYAQYLDDLSVGTTIKGSTISLLAQDRMVFSSPHVRLVVYWRVELNYLTAEAESAVFARASFPELWHEVDSPRNSLDKVPELFDRLVKERGVSEALKELVPLILEEPDV